MDIQLVLPSIPAHLRDPLLSEHSEINQNFAERRWRPSELSGGHFCEIVYTVISGYGSGAYAQKIIKPKPFDLACKKLENVKNLPRSFQILIPRMLPALYEIRNNRGVGHAGGDVNPNHMDAVLVTTACNWILAEMVRVFHNMSLSDAQIVVDNLADRRTPLIWQKGDLKRVLATDLSLSDQVVVLVASTPNGASIEQLAYWTDYKNKTYLRTKIVASLHRKRLLNFDAKTSIAEALPTGMSMASKIIASRSAQSDL
jgi:hypothetical protein